MNEHKYDVSITDLLSAELPHKEAKFQRSDIEGDLNKEPNTQEEQKLGATAQAQPAAENQEDKKKKATAEMTAVMITGGVQSLIKAGKLFVNSKIEEFFTDEEWMQLTDAQAKKPEDRDEDDRRLIIRSAKLDRKIETFEKDYDLSADEKDRLDYVMKLAAEQNDWKASANVMLMVEILNVFAYRGIAIKTF